MTAIFIVLAIFNYFVAYINFNIGNIFVALVNLAAAILCTISVLNYFLIN